MLRFTSIVVATAVFAYDPESIALLQANRVDMGAGVDVTTTAMLVPGDYGYRKQERKKRRKEERKARKENGVTRERWKTIKGLMNFFHPLALSRTRTINFTDVKDALKGDYPEFTLDLLTAGRFTVEELNEAIRRVITSVGEEVFETIMLKGAFDVIDVDNDNKLTAMEIATMDFEAVSNFFIGAEPEPEPTTAEPTTGESPKCLCPDVVLFNDPGLPAFGGSVGASYEGDTIILKYILSRQVHPAAGDCEALPLPTDVPNACGIHIHSGKTCEESGGHYLGNNTEDPWVPAKYTTIDGWAEGSVTSVIGTGLEAELQIDDHAVVVHDSTGVRIACALLRCACVPGL